MLAFVSPDDDVSRARIDELVVSPEEYRAAYDFLRRVNAQYDQVHWDEEAAVHLAPAADAFHIPEIFRPCLQRRQGDPLNPPWCVTHLYQNIEHLIFMLSTHDGVCSHGY